MLYGNSTFSKNSTSTPLGAGETFTGPFERCDQYNELRISSISDVPAANVFIETSFDGTNVAYTVTVATDKIGNNLYGTIHLLSPLIPFYRVRYVNGSDAQSTFNLSFVKAAAKSTLVSTATQPLNRFDDCSLSRPCSDYALDVSKGLSNYEKNLFITAANAAVTNAAEEVISPAGMLVYPFMTSATPVRIKGQTATDDSDDIGARSVEVIYLDANWQEKTETLITNGSSPSAFTTGSAIRVQSARVLTTGQGYGFSAVTNGANIGDITIEDASGNAYVVIKEGKGKSQSSVVSVPDGKIFFLTGVDVLVSRNDSADVRVWCRRKGDTTSAPFPSKEIVFECLDIEGDIHVKLQSFVKLEARTDIWITGIKRSGSGNPSISCFANFVETLE